MGLKIGERMHLVDIDENTPISLQENNYKHNIFIHLWGIYSTRHKFGVFTFLQYYQYTIYIHNNGYASTFLWIFCCILHNCNFKFSLKNT
jgi:hypothetical protein